MLWKKIGEKRDESKIHKWYSFSKNKPTLLADIVIKGNTFPTYGVLYSGYAFIENDPTSNTRCMKFNITGKFKDGFLSINTYSNDPTYYQWRPATREEYTEIRTVAFNEEEGTGITYDTYLSMFKDLP